MLKCCKMIRHIFADKGNCDKYYFVELNREATRILNKQVDQEERTETNWEGENLSRIELQHINNITDNTTVLLG